MGLRLRFNLILTLVSLAGFGGYALVAHLLLQEDAPQIVSVAMDLPLSDASRLYNAVMVSLAVVFALMFIALHLMMGRLILRPLRQMALAAERMSLGDFTLPEFCEKGRSEIAVLGAAFNRMRRSLVKAMDMIRHPSRR